MIEPIALTADEHRLFQLIASGVCEKEIAQDFGVPLSTVKCRIRALRHALGARNCAHLMGLVYRLGLSSYYPDPKEVDQRVDPHSEGGISDVA